MALDAGTVSGKLNLDTSAFEHGFHEAFTHAQEAGGKIREALEAIAEVATEVAGPAFGQMGQQIQSAFAGFSEGGLIGSLNLAGIALGTIREVTVDVAKDFHTIGLEATKAGVSSEFLGRIAAVGKTVDVPLQQISLGFKILEQRVADAEGGSKEAVDAFAKLGISVSEAGELSKEPEKLWQAVQDRLGEVANQSDRVKASQELLGRGGFNLIPIFAMQREAFNQTADTIEGLQGRATDANVKMSDDFNKLQVEVHAALEGIGVDLATPFLTYISEHKAEIEADIKSVASTLKDDLAEGFDYLKAHQAEFKADWEATVQFVKDMIPAAEAAGHAIEFAAEHLGRLVQLSGQVAGVNAQLNGDPNKSWFYHSLASGDDPTKPTNLADALSFRKSLAAQAAATAANPGGPVPDLHFAPHHTTAAEARAELDAVGARVQLAIPQITPLPSPQPTTQPTTQPIGPQAFDWSGVNLGLQELHDRIRDITDRFNSINTGPAVDAGAALASSSLGGSGPQPAGGGGGNVTYHIHVAPPDAHESAMQVAQRLKPAFQQLQRRHTDQLAGAAMLAAAQMSMGGGLG